ncbi:hypothetical protein POM88_003251 [Heracleum sosnowskyi]|uniref:Uncharacterized protein n=1 Tax=Heracleum sosnowskyi TaxID=360622 RepID=A0AAD8JJ78_9APIA|nr:hypothetical protein POM88_003251 [Heracleum sosnowskyi]
MKRISCGPGHGISIGSLGKDNSTCIVTKVVLDNAFFIGTTNGLRIKTWQDNQEARRELRKKNRGRSRFLMPSMFSLRNAKSCSVDKVVATGLPASPGAAIGQVVFCAEDAEAWHAQGKSAILVRTETSPEDVGGMTLCSLFDVPVFWSILLGYWIFQFVLTLKRHIMHMIKYKYVPLTMGKMEMESTSKLKRMHTGSNEARCPKRTKNLWTFEPIKQKYNFEAALTDLIDNSLQASWLDDSEFRHISIDINKDSISIIHNGTGIDSSQETSILEWGRTASEYKLEEQSVGDNDPYLRPFFGKFGYGVAVSSMHLGRHAKICSKSNALGELHIFDIQSYGSLQDSVGAHLWRTDGGMPSTSEEELMKASRGCFTKVEIFDLHIESLGLHKLMCRLKDIYFPYIQINKSSDQGTIFRPVEFKVNGQNLAEMDGGEVSITSLHACSPEFKLQLCLSSIPEVAGSSSTSRKGNARMTFVYFPIIQGDENTDRITKELDVRGCGIEGRFTFVSVRRLGRLLPNACWAPLPFMEPYKHKNGDEAHRLQRCYSRVKCFIELDGGFVPTQCKTDLMHEDPYTKALKSFGAQLPRNDQGLYIQILREENTISSLPELERLYKNWILNMHAKFDEEVVCSDQETIAVTVDPSNKALLGITADAVRVCKQVRRKGKFWQSGQRIKIWKGASAKFQKTNTYATIEYILIEKISGSTGGEAYFVCRKIDTPDDKGCLVTKNSDEGYTIDIREAVILPLRAIDSRKVTEVEFSLWNKKTKKQAENSHEDVTSSVLGQSADMINDSQADVPSNDINEIQLQDKEKYLWEENRRLKSRLLDYEKSEEALVTKERELRDNLAKAQKEYEEMCAESLSLSLKDKC